MESFSSLSDWPPPARGPTHQREDTLQIIQTEARLGLHLDSISSLPACHCVHCLALVSSPCSVAQSRVADRGDLILHPCCQALGLVLIHLLKKPYVFSFCNIIACRLEAMSAIIAYWANGTHSFYFFAISAHPYKLRWSWPPCDNSRSGLFIARSQRSCS